MDYDQFKNKIKSRGYWRINFRPLTENSIELSSCREIVERNAVNITGWRYPYYPRRASEDSDIYPINNSYFCWIDWDFHKEFWHMFQSTQFVQYLGLTEDWQDEGGITYTFDILPGKYLEVFWTVNQLTITFEFLKRLMFSNVYLDGVEVNISIENTSNRELIILTQNRMPLNENYICRSNRINYTNQYMKDEIELNSNEIALNVVQNIFEHFTWKSNLETLRQYQSKLLDR